MSWNYRVIKNVCRIPEIIQIDENGDKFVEILFGDFDS